MIPTLTELLQLDMADLLARVVPILLALGVSFALGLLIYGVYQRAFRGVVFNHAFAVSLALMTTLTTMITLAISSNIALSLGMVGALSIVRYRTAIKDPMDLLFLFWAVTTGITIGANMHYIAFIGAVIVILTLVFISRYSTNTQKYILVIHYSGEEIDEALRRILHQRRYQIKSKTVRQSGAELAVEIVVRNDNLAFVETLKGLPAISAVTLVQYSGDYGG